MHGKPYSSATILPICGLFSDNGLYPHPYCSIYTEVVHACHSKTRTLLLCGMVPLHTVTEISNYNCRCREG